MSNIEEIHELIRAAALDPTLVARRFELARLATDVFQKLGIELHVAGSLLGTDRLNCVSPGGNGSDETVAVALLLRVASELMGAALSSSLNRDTTLPQHSLDS